MAIAETGSVTATGTGTTLSVTHGLTINAGDVVLALIHWNLSGITVSDNNGGTPFTEAFQEQNGAETSHYAIFSRVAGASEPSSYSFNQNGASAAWSVQFRVFSGVDNATPFDVAPSAATRDFAASGTTAPAPSITINTAAALGVLFGLSDSTITFSAPTNGYATEVQTGERSNASYIRTWATTGATGTSSMTLSASNDWTAQQFALKPAGGGGWTGKILGVTNPAKVNGILVASIAKVNGVA